MKYLILLLIAFGIAFLYWVSKEMDGYLVDKYGIDTVSYPLCIALSLSTLWFTIEYGTTYTTSHILSIVSVSLLLLLLIVRMLYITKEYQFATSDIVIAIIANIFSCIGVYVVAFLLLAAICGSSNNKKRKRR